MKSLKPYLLAASLAAGIVSLSGPMVQAGAPHARAGAPHDQKDFYLKDGDRVVFYGDSITEQKLYTTYIESYCVTRFPNRKFTFFHSGVGGDRVTGGWAGPIDLRMKRDLLAYKPTVVTICLGMNDASYHPFNQNEFNTYMNGYEHILDTIKKELPNCRITLLTASAYDDVTQTAGFPGGYNASLLAYGEGVKALGRKYGLTVADTNAPLVSALARAEVTDPKEAKEIIHDRVHPGPGGHLVMASAVLRAWNAPATVAEVDIDAAKKQLVAQDNTRVSNLSFSDNKITFTHLDSALPWPIDRDPANNMDMQLVLNSTDIEQTLNNYTLRITGLSAASYAVKIDGQDAGTLSKEQLENGVDLAAIPGLPPNAQAREILALTRKHNDLHNARWRDVQMKNAKPGTDEVSADIQAKIADLDNQEMDVVKQQRMAAKPKPHTIELTAQ